MAAPPRYYIDLTVPKRGDGSDLFDCTRAGDYETYVHWIADYLHTADLQLSPLQKEWLERFSGGPSDLIFECSDSYGYAAAWLEDVDCHISEGLSFKEFKELVEPMWREENEDLDPEDRCSLEEYLGITEAEYNYRIFEIEQLGDDIENCIHADLPYRSLLCHALRRISSHDERYHEMDRYFRNFTENASK